VPPQDGKFDRADRLFHSVEACFTSCTSTSSDVKELTPEWYYLPDFLRNLNGLDLGTRYDGSVVCDVVLPPWAWYVVVHHLIPPPPPPPPPCCCLVSWKVRTSVLTLGPLPP
jgi:hypothetical protein